MRAASCGIPSSLSSSRIPADIASSPTMAPADASSMGSPISSRGTITRSRICTGSSGNSSAALFRSCRRLCVRTKPARLWSGAIPSKTPHRCAGTTAATRSGALSKNEKAYCRQTIVAVSTRKRNSTPVYRLFSLCYNTAKESVAGQRIP